MFTTDEDVIAYFTERQCGALAYELHKLKGYSLGMISSEPIGSPEYFGHLFVFDSEGLVIDIRGVRPLSEVEDEWYFCPYVHRFFSLVEFEYELLEWDMSPNHNKDKEAKRWAKYITDTLNNF